MNHPRPHMSLAERTSPVIVVIATITILHALGDGPLAAPPLTSVEGVRTWADARGPVDAAFAILRLIALVVAYHLAATTVLSGIGGLLRSRRLIQLAERVTLPMFRGALRRVVGLGLSTTLALTAPLPRAAADGPTTTRVVDAHGTATMREATAPNPTAEPDPTTEPDPTAQPDDSEVAEGHDTLVSDGTATIRLAEPGGEATLKIVPPEQPTAPPATPATPLTPASVDVAPSPTAAPKTTASAEAAPHPIDSAREPTAPQRSDHARRSSPPATAPRDGGDGHGRRDAPSPAPRIASEPKSADDGRDPEVQSGASPGSRRHVVHPGDHLWALAEAQVKEHLGRSPTDAEIAPHWNRVVNANPQLTDPDFLFPGDIVNLPLP